MKGVIVMISAVVAAVMLAAMPGEALSCGDVHGSLLPCLGYLTGGGGPSGSCCGGVRNLVGYLRSQQDRQTACYCMKSAASSYNVRSDMASNLPGKCGVSIGMTISPNIDCSRIS
ncbi:hypothetical protein OROGR_007710 [Orobanche gracilis]